MWKRQLRSPSRRYWRRRAWGAALVLAADWSVAAGSGRAESKSAGGAAAGPIRSHPEGVSAAGSRHPISLSSPLMS